MFFCVEYALILHFRFAEIRRAPSYAILCYLEYPYRTAYFVIDYRSSLSRSSTPSPTHPQVHARNGELAILKGMLESIALRCARSST